MRDCTLHELDVTHPVWRDLPECMQVIFDAFPKEESTEGGVLPSKTAIQEWVNKFRVIAEHIRAFQVIARRKMVIQFGNAADVHVFSEGDCVLVAFPPFVRPPLSNSRFDAQIVKVCGDQENPTYKILTEFGVLDRNVGASDLNTVPSLISMEIKEKFRDVPNEVKVTMHYIGRRMSTSPFRKLRCDCPGQCNTTRCICRKYKKPCSQYCGLNGHTACRHKARGRALTQVSIVALDSWGEVVG